MKRERPTLVIFQGGAFDSDTPIERIVLAAQHAATLDLLALAADSQAFDRAILVTEDQALIISARAEAGGLPLLIESHSGGAFHFGESLVSLCKAHNLRRVVYIGGAAMPLATVEHLRDLAVAVGGEGECVTSNNLFSADVAAFWPASALERISLPSADNDLAWQLHFKAGLPYAPMPRTLASQFDIDTPTDLATLWWSCQSPPLSNAVGNHLAEMLSQVPQAMPVLARNVELAYKAMATRRAQVFLAGRVSSWIWRRLEVNLPCQTRVVSEERGMRASGREERGEVVSMLGLYTDIAGIDGLVQVIERTSDAALLDSRVLFAHNRLKVSSHDRFASDALLHEQVSDPWVRELTQAVVAARVPIVLGGHSLVAGGAWALSERVRAVASVSRG